MARSSRQCFQQIDFHHQLDWLADLFEKHHCKPAIAIGDSNYLKILVKNRPDPDFRVMLIDYEMAGYAYRGVDIGGHFNERMYSWGHPTCTVTGFGAYDKSERKAFCEAYLEEMSELGQELGGDDTVEHLLIEAEVGTMWQILFSALMCVVFDEETESENLFLEGLVHVCETYGRLKGGFLERYGGG